MLELLCIPATLVSLWIGHAIAQRIADGPNLEVELLRQKIAMLEAELERLRARQELVVKQVD